MVKLTNFSKYLGTIWGLAAGDAIGYPVEFMTTDKILDLGGSAYICSQANSVEDNENQISDDTQMSVAVAKGLLESKTDNVDEIMYHISNQFVEWFDSPENNRAPGNNCMTGVKNLKMGLDWNSSGVINARTCGACMRTAPIGLAFYDDLDKLKEIASASAISTHNSKSAQASAVANAYLVARGIRNEDPKKIFESVYDFTRGISSSFSHKLKQLEGVLDKEPREAFSVIGEGWRGDEAVSGALYCILKTGFDYNKAVPMAADYSGDSDSVASIAGGIIGAHKGYRAIDRMFLRNLEKRDALQELSIKLCNKFYKNV
jgi:ADP-ribosylglycohydrolase